MGKAFYIREIPKEGQTIKSADIVHSDNPKFGMPITCQECKKGINVPNLSIKYIRENI